MNPIDYEKGTAITLSGLAKQENPILLGKRVLADVALMDGFDTKKEIIEWLLENRLSDFTRQGQPTIISIMKA